MIRKLKVKAASVPHKPNSLDQLFLQDSDGDEYYVSIKVNGKSVAFIKSGDTNTTIVPIDKLVLDSVTNHVFWRLDTDSVTPWHMSEEQPEEEQAIQEWVVKLCWHREAVAHSYNVSSKTEADAKNKAMFRLATDLKIKVQVVKTYFNSNPTALEIAPK